MRAFAAGTEPPAAGGSAYPQTYGTVEETVMSPYKGGPVYLWLRSSYIWFRRSPGRYWMRWLERNWTSKRCAWWEFQSIILIQRRIVGGTMSIQATTEECLTSRTKTFTDTF